MSKVTVSEKALRELVVEAFDGGHLGKLEEPPVNVSAVVDPSAAATDPINPNFVPRTKPELDVAVKQITKDVPIDNVPGFYKMLKSIVFIANENTEEDEEMSKAANGGVSVEEAIRHVVRKMLKESSKRSRSLKEAPLPPVKKIPYGVHGDEYMRKFKAARDDIAKRFASGAAEDIPDPDEEDIVDPKKRKAYKSTAIGGMVDVGGASFEEIAKELDFSVAGAKQAVDKALEKAKWLAQDITEDDLEIMVLTTMNDYINMLAKSGELSAADVQLMKDHPNIVRELDGFREFLATAIKRMRKQGKNLEDPLGESKEAYYRKCVNKALRLTGLSEAKDEMETCPDCKGSGWDNIADKDCELCLGHGELKKKDLYGYSVV